MAEFVEVINQRERMCKEHHVCSNCPLSLKNNGLSLGCFNAIERKPKEAEEIIMKWAEENPVKTNADKFKEVFGYDLAENISVHSCAWLNCESCDGKCEECECNGFWKKEYKEPKGSD